LFYGGDGPRQIKVDDGISELKVPSLAARLIADKKTAR